MLERPGGSNIGGWLAVDNALISEQPERSKRGIWQFVMAVNTTAEPGYVHIGTSISSITRPYKQYINTLVVLNERPRDGIGS